MAGADVELDGVSKRYRAGDQEIVALLDVSLEVEAGLVIAISGPSGSGKSTLLHVIGAMDSPDEGTIRCGEFEVSSLSAREQVAYRRRIGFVFQRFLLLPALSVLDNVIAPVMPFKVDFDKVERGRELLAAVGLVDRADSLPSKLSGGQQQRVAIARALINDPLLLLADEPTGNLDSTTGTEIVELILQLREERGMTVLVATHDENVASRSDKVIRISDGRIS
jgi:ABC-type antimicrobial peptide transport system, ATPase component